MSIDIMDQIDALIDEQLSEGEPIGGFDYDDPDYPKCPHCYRDWHGLAITARIEQMRRYGSYDEDYSYADDDSEVLCPGSTFIGPMPHPQGYDDGSPLPPSRPFPQGESVGLFQFCHPTWQVSIHRRLTPGEAILTQARCREIVVDYLSLIARTEEPKTGSRNVQDRALPRPSATPPMWAHDPTRTRRIRNRR
ncbi:hypothetical protein [Rhodococcus ruber]|uniref:hypothetical protein n=1 Tax=Rhodococcus ruber TaxID=1830 RepID=UPI003783DDED